MSFRNPAKNSIWHSFLLLVGLQSATLIMWHLANDVRKDRLAIIVCRTTPAPECYMATPLGANDIIKDSSVPFCIRSGKVENFAGRKPLQVELHLSGQLQSLASRAWWNMTFGKEQAPQNKNSSALDITRKSNQRLSQNPTFCIRADKRTTGWSLTGH